jgi:hypothetical protein
MPAKPFADTIISGGNDKRWDNNSQRLFGVSRRFLSAGLTLIFCSDMVDRSL